MMTLINELPAYRGVERNNKYGIYGENELCGHVQNAGENLKEQIRVITVGKHLKRC